MAYPMRNSCFVGLELIASQAQAGCKKVWFSLLLIGAASRRRSARQVVDLPNDGGVKCETAPNMCKPIDTAKHKHGNILHATTTIGTLGPFPKYRTTSLERLLSYPTIKWFRLGLCTLNSRRLLLVSSGLSTKHQCPGICCTSDGSSDVISLTRAALRLSNAAAHGGLRYETC
jgi:hypothetical protein